MIKSKDEIMSIIRARIGEEPSEEDTSFVEDITDTINDYETRLSDSTDWKTKYEQNDAEWRKKYTDRFFSSEGNGENNNLPNGENNNLPNGDESPKTFEDLFK